MNTGAERSNYNVNKLKYTAAIISLASTALIACGDQPDKNFHLSIVPVASADTNNQPYIVLQRPDFANLLEKDWDTYLNNHVGEVDIAAYDFTTGQVAHTHYPKEADGATFDTASIVKLSTLENLLLQSQTSGQPITPNQKAIAAEMIENSDNDAASILWNEVGDAPAMDDYWHQIGAVSTTAATGGNWGNTQTTAIDQLKVVNAVAYAGTPLSPLSVESGTVANELMDNVVPDQRWGVSGGVPSDMPVKLKNGWFPDAFTANAYSDTDDWTINSIGYTKGKYAIAVLTRGNPTMQDGIKTTEDLSTITWNDTQNPAELIVSR
ncbi:MAG: serine hydrolase [Candidatus Nomurabacteria bacterium]|nr:MAG: serine hydrolase [Candidatus Nomurabacteria bacterium]